MWTALTVSQSADVRSETRSQQNLTAGSESVTVKITAAYFCLHSLFIVSEESSFK